MKSQSSSSDSHRGAQKRSCFSSFAGRNPTDVGQSRNTSCLNTFVHSEKKPVEYEFGSFSSSDFNDFTKSMKTDSQSYCSSNKQSIKNEKALYNTIRSNSRPKNKFRKQKLKVSVASNHKVKSPLSPTEPFDPNSIKVPHSILTTQDDDNSVTVSITDSKILVLTFLCKVV